MTTNNKNKTDGMVVFMVLMFGMVLGTVTSAIVHNVTDGPDKEETCHNACFYRETEMKLQAKDVCVCDDNVVLTYSPEAVWQEK